MIPEKYDTVQDPVIFSGSLRSNLDPFGEAESDDAVWNALKQAGLEDVVQSMPVSHGQLRKQGIVISSMSIFSDQEQR